jgi:hypothetical protein
MRPLITYTPFKDLNVGNFVLMGLYNPNLVPLWMKMVRVQWWVL